MKHLAIRLHLWLGLVLGLLWSLQGLTGAALVFHREIDRWAHPEWSGGGGPMSSLDDIVAKAERATGRPLKNVGVLDTRPDVLTASYEDAAGTARTLFLDAENGAVVGARLTEPSLPTPGSTSRFLYMLHEHLLAGETGEIVIGTSGCFLLSAVLLGIWIAWPRRRQWRALFAVANWRSLPQKLYGWHRMVGLVASLLLALIALSGVYMIFSQSLRGAIGAVVKVEAPYRATPLAAPAPWRPAQAALDTALARFPDARFVRMAMPSAKAPVYAVRLRQPGELRAWAGTTSVTIDARTGRVLHVYDALGAPPANRVLDAQFSIHNGEIAGLAGRLLVLAAGLSLPAFYISGVWLWLRKRARRTAPRALPALA